MYLVDYLRNKKQVRIVDDTLPTIRTNESSPVFPMEVLEVLPNQRVGLENMSTGLQKALLKVIGNGRATYLSDAPRLGKRLQTFGARVGTQETFGRRLLR